MRYPAFFLRVAAPMAVLLTGCSQPAAPVRTYSMGEKVTLGNIIYTVFETQWLTQAGAPPDTRLPQNRFFLVRISAGNSGNSDLILPNLSVIDDKGNSYRELENGDGIPQWIGFLRSVHPAESAAGNMVFDCPAGHYKLKITDEEGEHTAMVDIPLSFTNETPEVPVPGSEAKKGQGDAQTLFPGGR
jgi:hypothetical protein